MISPCLIYISSKDNEPKMKLETELICFSFIVCIVYTLIPSSPVIPCFPTKSFVFLITQLELGSFLQKNLTSYVRTLHSPHNLDIIQFLYP